MSESRLFVGNLSYQTMENDLQEYFSQAGVVSSVNLMLDKFTGKSRGFAFIEYSSSEEANKAVEMFHNKDFQGRALTVNIARPERRSSAAQRRWWRRRRRTSRTLLINFSSSTRAGLSHPIRPVFFEHRPAE